MKDQTRDLLQKSAPWQRGAAWQLLVAEGAILVIVGIFIVANPDGASDVIRQLIAAILLVNSAVIAVNGIRQGDRPALALNMFRAGIGATVGTIVVLESVSDYLDASTSRIILGWGLIAFALLALAGIVVEREERGLPIGRLVVAGFNIVIGLLFLTGTEDSSSRSTVIGIIAIVFGLLLVAYGVFLARNATPPPPEIGEPTPPSSPI